MCGAHSARLDGALESKFDSSGQAVFALRHRLGLQKDSLRRRKAKKDVVAGRVALLLEYVYFEL